MNNINFESIKEQVIKEFILSNNLNSGNYNITLEQVCAYYLQKYNSLPQSVVNKTDYLYHKNLRAEDLNKLFNLTGLDIAIVRSFIEYLKNWLIEQEYNAKVRINNLTNRVNSLYKKAERLSLYQNALINGMRVYGSACDSSDDIDFSNTTAILDPIEGKIRSKSVNITPVILKDFTAVPLMSYSSIQISGQKITIKTRTLDPRGMAVTLKYNFTATTINKVSLSCSDSSLSVASYVNGAVRELGSSVKNSSITFGDIRVDNLWFTVSKSPVNSENGVYTYVFDIQSVQAEYSTQQDTIATFNPIDIDNLKSNKISFVANSENVVFQLKYKLGEEWQPWSTIESGDSIELEDVSPTYYDCTIGTLNNRYVNTYNVGLDIEDALVSDIPNITILRHYGDLLYKGENWYGGYLIIDSVDFVYDGTNHPAFINGQNITSATTLVPGIYTITISSQHKSNLILYLTSFNENVKFTGTISKYISLYDFVNIIEDSGSNSLSYFTIIDSAVMIKYSSDTEVIKGRLPNQSGLTGIQVRGLLSSNGFINDYKVKVY